MPIKVKLLRWNPRWIAPAGYTNLGWLNGGTPEAWKACEAAGHECDNVDASHREYRGTDHVYICHTCRHFTRSISAINNHAPTPDGRGGPFWRDGNEGVYRTTAAGRTAGHS